MDQPASLPRCGPPPGVASGVAHHRRTSAFSSRRAGLSAPNGGVVIAVARSSLGVPGTGAYFAFARAFGRIVVVFHPPAFGGRVCVS